MGGDGDATDEMRQLEALLRAELGDGKAVVESLTRLTGGASRETSKFTVVWSSGEHQDLILRRDPPGSSRGEGMVREALAMRAAGDAGVPEPSVLLYGGDGSPLGTPFMVTTFVDGETIARRILREDEFGPAREILAEQCGEILAKIHSVDWHALPGFDEELQDPLDRCAAELGELAEPHPALELGVRWLAQRRPDPVQASLVHGDFRHGNLIIGPEGVRAVLDWEVVHVGDPLEDLGWMCVKAWRFGSREPVGGFGTYEQLLRGYAKISGRAVDLDSLRWWEAFGTLRWGLGCIRQAQRHLDGTTRSVELAAIGRRTAEQEWDLLNIIRELSDA